MGKDPKEKLNEVIDTDLEGLIVLEQGSDERQKAVEDVVKLMKLKHEEARLEQESKDSKKKSTMEMFKIGGEISLGVANLTLAWIGLKKTFKFEETGTICSKAGNAIFNRVTKFFK